MKKHWLVAAMFLFVLCVFFTADRIYSSVTAQVGLTPSGNDDIRVIPIQIARDSFGIAMVDSVSQTMWIYELNNHGPAHSRLQLFAARSWKYDRLLQQYNTADPKPQQIKDSLDKLKQPEDNAKNADTNDSEAIVSDGEFEYYTNENQK